MMNTTTTHPQTISDIQVRALFPSYSSLERTAYQRGYRWAMTDSEDWQRELVTNSDHNPALVPDGDDGLRAWWRETLANPLERDEDQLAEDYRAFVDKADIGTNASTAMKVLPPSAVEAFVQGALDAIELLDDAEQVSTE